MNLIANSGIQYFTFPLDVNMDDKFKMFFHESFDIKSEKLTLEIAHFFNEEEVWVKKHDLFLLGYLTDGKVGRMEDDEFVSFKWAEVKEDFEANYKSVVKPEESDDGGTNSFSMSLNRLRFEKFENQWLPFPFFNVHSNGKSDFGPTNWCRFKLIPINAKDHKYQILLAFDTRSLHESEGFEDDDLMEAPVFSSVYEQFKDFAVCNNEFSLIDFCSSTRNCEWVDSRVMSLFHPNISDINEGKIRKPKLRYLAQYIYLVNYLQQLDILPKIKLFSDKNVEFGKVDLVLDVGNSRTCAVLFDESDFTKVEPLGLQNFSNPLRDGKLNRDTNSFDMRLAFREADFGGDFIYGSSQFVYPSMVRLGKEAKELIHQATNVNEGIEKITTFSSPKRYLWDDKPQEKEWEFIALPGEKSKPIWIKGINEQLNNDGTLNLDGNGGVLQYYSRKSLMTLSFIEILSQAKMQINSYEFRHKWGKENIPRRIGRVIISCPTAMSRNEQIALRKCAEDASIILSRFYDETYNKEIDEAEARKVVNVVPSVNSLSRDEEEKEWIYDEATAAQFVYLYAEITKRYRNNSKEFFNFYGKVRNDIDNYFKKSLTIGSVDIGAGTTDIMISVYKESDSKQPMLTPIPLFWESFYRAGDDLLKSLIQKLIIEGQHAAVQNKLQDISAEDIETKILDYFGIDNARLSVTDRQHRSEFNLQVSIPVVTKFLELLGDNVIEKANLSFDDVFPVIKPSERVMSHFQQHFGFTLNSIEWTYDKAIISKIIESTFDKLIGKISTVLSYYGCDIVLLSGRPTSLKPLSDLFLKHYAVPPNRLITLNNYRIGTWYPFQNGLGYLKDAKSIVAVGAMIGDFASTRGGLDGFYLDLSVLRKKMLPTTDYFSLSEKGNSFISPSENSASIEISQLPIRIWTRQLNTPSYPSRPFYLLDFNLCKIEELCIDKNDFKENDKHLIKASVNKELERLRRLGPFKIKIERESFQEDKEALRIESVMDCNGDELSTRYFSLVIQSMGEGESYWLDSGSFSNLNFNHC